MMQRVAETHGSGPFKVSVAMLAFNHRAFIAQAMESVLMQTTSFPVELVVGEDASGDGTREIVQDYASRYPRLIKPILHATNQGMMRNLEAVVSRCSGEYVALLEGDDYWLGPHKLQRQADILDADHSLSFCFHAVKVIHDDPSLDYLSNEGQAIVTRLEDVIDDWYARTCSIVYRRSFFPAVPKEALALRSGDTPMQLALALKGPVFFLRETLGVYRRHGGGATSTTAFHHEREPSNARQIFRWFDEFSQGRHTRLLWKKMGKIHLFLSERHRAEGRHGRALRDRFLSLAWYLRSGSADGLKLWLYHGLVPRRWKRAYLGLLSRRRRRAGKRVGAR